jgi:hypothetical protein
LELDQWTYWNASLAHGATLARRLQSVILGVMEADDKNDHDVADIVCEECKSILVTLHAPSTSRTVVRTKKAAKASEMAAPRNRSSD